MRARTEGRDPHVKDATRSRAGAVVAVPHARARNDRCAVHALRVWLDAANESLFSTQIRKRVLR